MFLSIISGLHHWAGQVLHILNQKLTHLAPQDFCIIVVLGISVGYCLLKGRSL